MKFTKHAPLVHQDNNGDFYAVCTCGQNSGPNHFGKAQRWKAEDWVSTHNDQVQHALAVLHRHGGSSRTDRDHARKMLDDPNVSAKDKAVWQIIYDGAEKRLRDLGGPNPETNGLWQPDTAHVFPSTVTKPEPIITGLGALSFPPLGVTGRYPERDTKEQAMSHVVPAARQLLAEIGELAGKAEVLTERDGLGFYRSIRLTKATADKLGEDVLAALESDRRVAEVVKSSKGVRITFASTAAADNAEPFGLSSVI